MSISPTLGRISYLFMKRLDLHCIKASSKRAGDMAMEFAVGAFAAQKMIEHARGIPQESVDFSKFVFLVQVRGATEVEKMAKQYKQESLFKLMGEGGKSKEEAISIFEKEIEIN